MSRVDAAFLAVHKAAVAGHDTKGAVLGSDAFFPFRDGIDQAAEADPAVYPQLKRMLVDGLMPRLATLKSAMTAGAVTLETLPPEIKRDWIAADGTARIAIFPSGDDNDSGSSSSDAPPQLKKKGEEPAPADKPKQP